MRSPIRFTVLVAVLALLAACSGSDTATEIAADNADTDATVVEDDSDDGVVEDDSDNTVIEDAESSGDVADSTDAETAAVGDTSTFTAEVWADNWFALYVNGELVLEDPVSITTERSFNAETVTFEATYPLTIAIEAKDFKETDSGIEYIGENNQQMGDGGLIAQVTDTSTGEVVASTTSEWTSLVVHRAPLNTECETDPDPDATCLFEILDTPADWTSTNFDDSAWTTATEWTEAEVNPRFGYDEINWNGDAQLIWGTDLEVDNTVLFRTTVAS